MKLMRRGWAWYCGLNETGRYNLGIFILTSILIVGAIAIIPLAHN